MIAAMAVNMVMAAGITKQQHISMLGGGGGPLENMMHAHVTVMTANTIATMPVAEIAGPTVPLSSNRDPFWIEGGILSPNRAPFWLGVECHILPSPNRDPFWIGVPAAFTAASIRVRSWSDSNIGNKLFVCSNNIPRSDGEAIPTV
jgi:hypothetical protein